MKRVFIIHGWSGSPETNWLPWLKKELEQQGYEVVAPAMPDTDTPDIEAWVEKLAEVVGKPDEQTYFIGHSIGCQAILRYLETIKTPVGGALFVAGWFNLEGLDEEETTIARPWLETPINTEKVKNVLPKSILIISDNDDFGAFEENKEKFASFVTHTIVLPNAGHITDHQEPAILSQFSNLMA
jgi:predicted alpha/beta hydrolase family esterase